MGLGLNARQRAGFQQAAQAGQGAQYLGQNRNVAQRVQNRVQAGSPQEARLQNFLATGQSQRPQRRPVQSFGPAQIGPPLGGPPPTPQPPVMGGMAGGNMWNKPMPGGDLGTMQDALTGQFGGGMQPMPRGGGMMPGQGASGYFGGGGYQPMGGGNPFGVNPGMQSVVASRFPGGGQFNDPRMYGGGMGGGSAYNPMTGGNYALGGQGGGGGMGGGNFGFGGSNTQYNPNWNQPQTGPQPSRAGENWSGVPFNQQSNKPNPFMGMGTGRIAPRPAMAGQGYAI